MNIQQTKETLKVMIASSDKLKQGFAAMVLIAPQILSGDDYHELKGDVDMLATNFDTCSSYLAEFSRMGVASKNFSPIKK